MVICLLKNYKKGSGIGGYVLVEINYNNKKSSYKVNGEDIWDEKGEILYMFNELLKQLNEDGVIKEV